MRVVVHTPRLLAETYEISDKLAGATDSAILAFLASGEADAGRVHCEVVNAGLPRLHYRSGTDVSALGAQLSDAKAAVDRLMEEAIEVVRPLIENGELSERAAAADLGVDRNTLRAWLGKPRTS